MPQESKGPVSFSTNIGDTHIPFQINCNCNTEIFNFFQHCQELNPLRCRKPGFICQFSCQLHHVAFDWLKSHAPVPSPIA